jgi:hypothetical protein
MASPMQYLDPNRGPMLFHFVIHHMGARHLSVLFGIGPAAWFFVVVVDLVMRAVMRRSIPTTT